MNIVHDEFVWNFSEMRVLPEGATLEAKHPEGKYLFEGFTTLQPAHNDGILISVFFPTESVVTNRSSVKKYVSLMGS